MMPAKSQPAPKQFAESLSGLIERVTFFNEENGFAVIKAGQQRSGQGNDQRAGTDLFTAPEAGGGNHRSPDQEPLRLAVSLPGD